ncbi:nuclear transport factor 2 family protein [Actinomyces viscosus]|uniref:nuclear transport factor 2 family protein n=1 Tax=Actinomyces viscosus TaxID=1656 RepID=UPI0028EF7AB9|nr:nuclear transport factor 2 family protein [Actinomyces viscosus]
MTADSKTTSGKALDVATAYHEAWTSGDLNRAMSFVDDDIVVHAPGKEINGKEEYRTYLGGFMKVMEGYTPRAAFGDDNTAVLYYFPHTPETRSSPASECFLVESGLIKESHLVFDRLSYRPPTALQ